MESICLFYSRWQRTNEKNKHDEVQIAQLNTFLNGIEVGASDPNIAINYWQIK